ncbi:alpha/beta hydrolase [Jongsikchunia kroppenstedtii]|uniref:alpha/beta hydrolase n=1 Tax=Jongsikchunia kroppenstedtii TaxID=1121721 RepID=UPI000370DA4C|nr:alpha/beta hydrolase [Jongsikchunia kroppenstedtii]
MTATQPSGTDPTEFRLAGHAGDLAAVRWTGTDAPTPSSGSFVVLITHGYGEHARRYDYLAERLVDAGAVVYALDHVGHGRSAGERVLITDFDKVVDDVHLLALRAREEYPNLPVALIGHSMGGLIATRYTQRFGDELAAVVLSGPVIGPQGMLAALLELDEIPDTPLPPDALSRVPEVGAQYTADPLVWHGAFKRPTVLAMKEMEDTIAASGRLTPPTIWLHGELDPLANYADAAIGWAQVKPEVSAEKMYPEARHEIFNEINRDEVIDDAIEFIRAHL